MVDRQEVAGPLHVLVEEGELRTFGSILKSSLTIMESGEDTAGNENGGNPWEQGVEGAWEDRDTPRQQEGSGGDEEWNAGEDIAELVLKQQQGRDIHGDGGEGEEGGLGVPAFPGDEGPGDASEKQEVVDREIRLVCDGGCHE